MSPVAAASVAPLAVLILAWDEAAPAVRTLIEATQASETTVDSVLMLVPHASEPGILSAEEYLPLPAEQLAAALATEGPATELPATETLTTEPLETTPEASAPAPAVDLQPAAAPVPLASTPLASPTELPAATATLPPAAPQWAAVRVLRLGAMPLSELAARAGQALPAPTWMGVGTAPAAPYLGASPSLASQPAHAAFAAPATSPADAPALPITTITATPLDALQPVALAKLPVAPPAYAPAQEPALASEVAADALPAMPDQLASFEATASLPLDETTLPAEPSPAQAGWPEALAALQQPSALPAPPAASALPEEGTAAIDLGRVPAALHPVAQHFSALNLNFQIIQYARFAVPVALAETPFEVVYAPAWPTWLAAQELRQRTKQPLVLHVASLAAAAGESLETATGWVPELQRQALRRADLVLAETAALAYRIRHDLGLAAASVRTVPAADAGALAQALRTAQRRSPADDVTFAGHDGF